MKLNNFESFESFKSFKNLQTNEQNSSNEFKYSKFLTFLATFLVVSSSGITNLNAKLAQDTTQAIKTEVQLSQLDTEIYSNDIEAKNDIRIELKLSTYTMKVFLGDTVIESFKVGIGKDICILSNGVKIDCKTPVGAWEVDFKTINPHPKDPRKSLENCKVGSVLGCKYVNFKSSYDEKTKIADFWGAHGTPFINSIGKNESSGCVRMNPVDAEKFFPLVKLGTKFDIIE